MNFGTRNFRRSRRNCRQSCQLEPIEREAATRRLRALCRSIRVRPILLPLPILDKNVDTFGALQRKCASREPNGAGPQRLARCRRRGSNPAPRCFASPRRGGGRSVTCDSELPTVTARARRGPAVPDAVRTQRGPATSSLSGFCTRDSFCRMAPATWANGVSLETVRSCSAAMACGPSVSGAGVTAIA